MLPFDIRIRLLYEAAQQLGWLDDPASLAERVAALERGLPAEDEFMVLLGWLGRCRFVHKMSQEQHPPESRAEFRVPDLLATFAFEGTNVPVLVEVKTSEKEVLSWKPDYLRALRRYADLLRLPVLIAWKHSGIWALFDPDLFRVATSNFKIHFLEALKHSLLGVLAGDFTYSLRKGVGFHVRFRVDERLSDTHVRATITDAFFTDGEGQRHTNVPGLLTALLCFEQDVESSEEGEYITQSYIVAADDQAEFAHRALVQLLAQASSDRAVVNWRKYLQEADLPPLTKNFETLILELGSDFTSLVLRQVPPAIPPFLVRRATLH